MRYSSLTAKLMRNIAMLIHGVLLLVSVLPYVGYLVTVRS